MKRYPVLLMFCLSLLFTMKSVHVQAENYPYRSDVLWTTIPNHADWLYKAGEKATIEVTFLKYGIPRDCEVEFQLAQDMLKPFKNGKVHLKNGRAKIEVGTMNKPGFLDCVLKANVDGTVYTHHAKVGFSPEKLTPTTKNPSDFDIFWQKTLQDARKQQPLEYTMKKVERYSDQEIDCYLVKLKVDRTHSVYAYLTKPTKKGSYPVVLCPPGAGVKTIKEPMRHSYYARNGMIRMEMEIHGINPELSEEDFKDVRSAFSEYLDMGLDNRENYYMRHVYTACVRAIDFLTSLDEWDGKNTIVQGGSQGGALSLITAALDKRVTLSVVNHPALSEMAGYANGGTGGYPHFVKKNGMLTPEKIKTMAYYDVVNFARRITCPVYMTWGFNDNTCPPTTSYMVWNLLQGPKDSLITPINEHWTSDATEYGQMVYIKNHLK